MLWFVKCLALATLLNMPTGYTKNKCELSPLQSENLECCIFSLATNFCWRRQKYVLSWQI